VGGRSPLILQMALELDRQIESLLGVLSSEAGENGFDLVLAGAHGAPPLPAAETRERMAVAGETVAQKVAQRLSANNYGGVERYVYPFLYLDTSGFADPEMVRQTAARAALEHPGVAGYYTAGGLCSTQDEWQNRFKNSFHPQRSGDVMLAYRPEYVED